jgi:hypothetical protein
MILTYLEDLRTCAKPAATPEQAQVRAALTTSDLIDLINTAITTCDRTIVLYEELVEQGGREDLVPRLAEACHVNANLAKVCHNDNAAAGQFCRAIVLYKWWVEKKGRLEWQGTLALTLLSRAEIWIALDKRQAALADAQEAQRILTAEITLNGRTELQGQLDQAVRLIQDVSAKVQTS